MASSPEAERPAAIVSLPTLDDGARAILHRPTGLLIVSRDGICASGSLEDMARLAAEITAACWEARRAREDRRVRTTI